MRIRFLVNSTVKGVSYVPGDEDTFRQTTGETIISLGGGVEIDEPGSASSEPEPTESVAASTPKIWNSKRRK